jgi:hypothetical protein
MNQYCELVSDKQAGAVATPSTIQDKMAASSYWYLKLAASETTATVTCIPRLFLTSWTSTLTIRRLLCDLKYRHPVILRKCP